MLFYPLRVLRDMFRFYIAYAAIAIELDCMGWGGRATIVAEICRDIKGANLANDRI